MRDEKEEYQINKVKEKIPKWFSTNKTQISQTILLNYLELYFSNTFVTYSMLKNKSSNLFTFSTNFSKMIDYTDKNHGKVFSKNNDMVYLWNPVKDFILNEYAKYKNISYDITYPDDIENTHIIEGKKQTIIVNTYERNPIARAKCIEHYGYNCSVCGFNFEKVYGKYGKDFIHVHHIIPISTINDTYKIDPIKDLRPVCPNCHAMLHRKKDVKSIEKLKEIIN
jgi:5-methylcytosine-specific restriction protein A